MRVRLGDIVPMPLPDSPDASLLPGSVLPMVPSLPYDLAGNFLSSGSPASTVLPYAVDTDAPLLDSQVTGGPGFVPILPEGNVPAFRSPGPPKNPWRHTPIIPDSILPFALKRDAWARETPLFQANRWDQAIATESQFWQWIASHGGIRSCCRIPELGAPIWSYPPWQVMPSNGIRFGPQNIFFQPIANVSGGAPFTGVDTILGQFRVEVGYEGVITHFVCGFNGNGFDDGSGNIIWRLKIGQRYAKDAGNVKTTFGDLKTALTVPGSGYRLQSGQTVQLIANIPVNSPVNAGQVFAGVLGWTYPRR